MISNTAGRGSAADARRFSLPAFRLCCWEQQVKGAAASRQLIRYRRPLSRFEETFKPPSQPHVSHTFLIFRLPDINSRLT